MSSGYDTYAEDVRSSAIIVGEYIHLAVDRYYTMLDNPRYEFRPEIVARVIRFFSRLRHGTGRYAGKPFILMPWQEFCVANIFGFYYKGTEERVCKSVYLEIARKNGKTAFAAGIALYCLIADGENEAEVDFAANCKDQAGIAFKISKTFIRALNSEKLSVYRDYVIYDKDGQENIISVLAADDTKLDGFNPSVYILDEFHAAKNGKLRDVLESGMGMRDNPLSIIITTAGFDKSGPCYQTRDTNIEILRGIKEDETQFSAIYSIDINDDWKDPSVWGKASPNLDVTVKSDYMQRQIQKAINTPSLEVGVRTKNLNEWMDSDQTWIASDYIVKATKNINLKDSDMPLFVGVDLSSISDLTAVAYLYNVDGRFKAKIDYYLPEQALKDKYLKSQYQEWARRGVLKITPGNVTDYDYITADMLRYSEKPGIFKVGYDSWNATQWAISATSLGLPLVEYSQSIGNFNQPTKELERLFLAGNIDIDNNEVTRFCFKNVVLKSDFNGNCKPDKSCSKNKIDGCIALIQALGMYLQTPMYSNFSI
jgi:Phage terminase-like protein, large subunit